MELLLRSEGLLILYLPFTHLHVDIGDNLVKNLEKSEQMVTQRNTFKNIV